MDWTGWRRSFHNADYTRARYNRGMDNHGMKRCYRCTETKETVAFGVNRREKDGLAQECKSCKQERSKAYRQRTRLRGIAAMEMDAPKTCTRCHQTKPRADFGKMCSEKDGLRRQCRECRRQEHQQSVEKNCARARAWVQANPERKRAYDKAYQETHAERLREQKSAQYYANWEHRRATITAYQKANRDKIAAWKKASPSFQAAIRRWKETNKEKLRADMRSWRDANQDKIRNSKKAWLAQHPGYMSAHVKRWKEKYPERAQALDARMRAQRAGVMGDGSVTETEWARILKFYGHQCAICHMPKSRKTPLHVDHYIPLSKKGGVHNWMNVWPLCPPCNNSKYNHVLPGAPPHAIAFMLEAS